MPIITLTTDLGYSDFYLASLKAKIISQFPEVQIIDISHGVQKFNIAEAAFILKSVMDDFPIDTVHIVGVGTSAADDVTHLGIRYKKQYILAADNGFISLIADQQPEMVVTLTMKIDSDFLAFPTRDLYAPAAVFLSKGGTLEVIGRATTDYVKRALIQPMTGADYIKGMVTYVDEYGNAITNINQTLFNSVGKGREFLIGFIQKGYEIDSLGRRYSDTPEGDRLAMFNSSGYLEIAINQGHAANLLGLVREEIVIVSFFDD